MNIWFGLFTLAFISITTVAIYLKHKTFRTIVWNIIRFVIVGITVYIGRDATDVMAIILYSMVMGACFLISVMHAYNKLFAPNQTYESIGETRKPKSFGNDYWE